jgi:uncharacterized membrane protein
MLLLCWLGAIAVLHPRARVTRHHAFCVNRRRRPGATLYAPAHRAVGRSRSGSWSTTRTVIWFCGERSPGHYVDVDEAAHVSEAGAAKGWRTGALIGFLLGPPGFAVGSVVGAASQEGEPGERDREPTLLVDKLRAAVPAPGSGVVLVADAGDVDEMLSAFALGDAQVTHRTLSAEDLAVVNAALSEALAAASAPPRARRGGSRAALSQPALARGGVNHAKSVTTAHPERMHAPAMDKASIKAVKK